MGGVLGLLIPAATKQKIKDAIVYGTHRVFGKVRSNAQRIAFGCALIVCTCGCAAGLPSDATTSLELHTRDAREACQWT